LRAFALAAMHGGMTSESDSGYGGASIVIGASGGIGAAIADALDSRTVGPVHRLSRTGPNGLDLTDPLSIVRSLDAALAGPPIGHVIIATGVLHDVAADGEMRGPEKSLRELDPEWLARQFAVNAIGPALILAHLLPRLPRDRPVRVAALGARVGSIADNRLGGWYGYRASKAALHQIVRTAAIEWQRTHKLGVLVALHPGTVDTRLSAPFAARSGNRTLLSPVQSAAAMLAVLDQLSPEESGRIYDWNGAEISP
jgi:NAD(P)-dependent dehydrogenase (short-subunit alcohol dehydrogenase family)